jgi:hypothetical protein
MAKKILSVLICFIGLMIFISSLYGQSSKKTITLPSGEVVYDLNGEWNASVENYGIWSQHGSYQLMMKITQTGSSLVAIRLLETPYFSKGSEAIRGELDKSGFKKVQLLSAMGPLDAKGLINEDGNIIVVDDGEKTRTTLTRK